MITMNTRNKGFFLTLAATLGLAVLAGCATVLAPAAPLQLAGIVGGSETQPTLNGQPLQLTGASITLDGAAATASAIAPGVELFGDGTGASGVLNANSIDVRTRVKGTVDAIDFTGSTLDVAGIRVKVDALTNIREEDPDGSISSLTLGDLLVGDYLEIYGAPQPGDEVLATRIVRESTGNPDRVAFRMPLRNLDSTAMSFTYGLQTFTVDYSGAQLRGTLVEGEVARVEGVKSGNTILATKVRSGNGDGDHDHPSDPGTRVELEGPLSNLDTAAQTFMVLSFLVDYSGARVQGTLVEGARVEVKGTADPATSTIMASKVEVKHESGGSGRSDGEQKGLVDAVDPTAMTLSVGGSTFWADAGTKVERDDADASFTDIQVSDWVEIKLDSTRTNADGFSYAAKIEIESHHDGGGDGGDGGNGDNEELRGVISNFDALNQTFDIGSTHVVVQNTTEYQDDATDRDLSESDFWGTDRSGARVKVEGSLAGDTVTARQIKLR